MDKIKIEKHTQSTGNIIFTAWRYDENNKIVCYVACNQSKEALTDFINNVGNCWSKDAILVL